MGKGKSEATVTKAQQLLSLALAIIVAAVGLSFAYSSLERFMYPTPVWYSGLYFRIILATALVKLLLFFFFKNIAKRSNSPVIKVMKTDSVLDFFITLTTLVSFTLTRYTEFTVDAVFGIIISIVIVINAIGMIKEYLLEVLNIVPSEKRKVLEELIISFDSIEKVQRINYYIGENEEITATAEAEFSSDLSREELKENSEIISRESLEKTGIKLKFTI